MGAGSANKVFLGQAGLEPAPTNVGDTMDHVCSNPAKWHPAMHTHQNHHHPPLAWRRKLPQEAIWWRILPLCGLCHDEYHTLLDLYVRYKIVPPLSLLRTYSVYIRGLVVEAWWNRPEGDLPYTLTREEMP